MRSLPDVLATVQGLRPVLPLSLPDFVHVQTPDRLEPGGRFQNVFASTSDRGKMVPCCTQGASQCLQLVLPPPLGIRRRFGSRHVLLQNLVDSSLQLVYSHLQVIFGGNSSRPESLGSFLDTSSRISFQSALSYIRSSSLVLILYRVHPEMSASGFVIRPMIVLMDAAVLTRLGSGH